MDSQPGSAPGGEEGLYEGRDIKVQWPVDEVEDEASDREVTYEEYRGRVYKSSPAKREQGMPWHIQYDDEDQQWGSFCKQDGKEVWKPKLTQSADGEMYDDERVMEFSWAKRRGRPPGKGTGGRGAAAKRGRPSAEGQKRKPGRPRKNPEPVPEARTTSAKRLMLADSSDDEEPRKSNQTNPTHASAGHINTTQSQQPHFAVPASAATTEPGRAAVKRPADDATLSSPAKKHAVATTSDIVAKASSPPPSKAPPSHPAQPIKATAEAPSAALCASQVKPEAGKESSPSRPKGRLTHPSIEMARHKGEARQVKVLDGPIKTHLAGASGSGLQHKAAGSMDVKPKPRVMTFGGEPKPTQGPRVNPFGKPSQSQAHTVKAGAASMGAAVNSEAAASGMQVQVLPVIKSEAAPALKLDADAVVQGTPVSPTGPGRPTTTATSTPMHGVSPGALPISPAYCPTAADAPRDGSSAADDAALGLISVGSIAQQALLLNAAHSLRHSSSQHSLGPSPASGSGLDERGVMSRASHDLDHPMTAPHSGASGQAEPSNQSNGTPYGDLVAHIRKAARQDGTSRDTDATAIGSLLGTTPVQSSATTVTQLGTGGAVKTVKLAAREPQAESRDPRARDPRQDGVLRAAGFQLSREPEQVQKFKAALELLTLQTKSVKETSQSALDAAKTAKGCGPVVRAIADRSQTLQEFLNHAPADAVRALQDKRFALVFLLDNMLQRVHGQKQQALNAASGSPTEAAEAAMFARDLSTKIASCCRHVIPGCLPGNQPPDTGKADKLRKVLNTWEGRKYFEEGEMRFVKELFELEMQRVEQPQDAARMYGSKEVPLTLAPPPGVSRSVYGPHRIVLSSCARMQTTEEAMEMRQVGADGQLYFECRNLMGPESEPFWLPNQYGSMANDAYKMHSTPQLLEPCFGKLPHWAESDMDELWHEEEWEKTWFSGAMPWKSYCIYMQLGTTTEEEEGVASEPPPATQQGQQQQEAVAPAVSAAGSVLGPGMLPPHMQQGMMATNMAQAMQQMMQQAMQQGMPAVEATMQQMMAGMGGMPGMGMMSQEMLALQQLMMQAGPGGSMLTPQQFMAAMSSAMSGMGMGRGLGNIASNMPASMMQQQQQQPCLAADQLTISDSSQQGMQGRPMSQGGGESQPQGTQTGAIPTSPVDVGEGDVGGAYGTEEYGFGEAGELPTVGKDEFTAEGLEQEQDVGDMYAHMPAAPTRQEEDMQLESSSDDDDAYQPQGITPQHATAPWQSQYSSQSQPPQQQQYGQQRQLQQRPPWQQPLPPAPEPHAYSQPPLPGAPPLPPPSVAFPQQPAVASMPQHMQGFPSLPPGFMPPALHQQHQQQHAAMMNVQQHMQQQYGHMQPPMGLPPLPSEPPLPPPLPDEPPPLPDGDDPPPPPPHSRPHSHPMEGGRIRKGAQAAQAFQPQGGAGMHSTEMAAATSILSTSSAAGTAGDASSLLPPHLQALLNMPGLAGVQPAKQQPASSRQNTSGRIMAAPAPVAPATQRNAATAVAERGACRSSQQQPPVAVTPSSVPPVAEHGREGRSVVVAVEGHHPTADQGGVCNGHVSSIHKENTAVSAAAGPATASGKSAVAPTRSSSLAPGSKHKRTPIVFEQAGPTKQNSSNGTLLTDQGAVSAAAVENGGVQHSRTEARRSGSGIQSRLQAAQPEEGDKLSTSDDPDSQTKPAQRTPLAPTTSEVARHGSQRPAAAAAPGYDADVAAESPLGGCVQQQQQHKPPGSKRHREARGQQDVSSMEAADLLPSLLPLPDAPPFSLHAGAVSDTSRPKPSRLEYEQHRGSGMRADAPARQRGQPDDMEQHASVMQRRGSHGPHALNEELSRQPDGGWQGREKDWVRPNGRAAPYQTQRFNNHTRDLVDGTQLRWHDAGPLRAGKSSLERVEHRDRDAQLPSVSASASQVTAAAEPGRMSVKDRLQRPLGPRPTDHQDSCQDAAEPRSSKPRPPRARMFLSAVVGAISSTQGRSHGRLNKS